MLTSAPEDRTSATSRARALGSVDVRVLVICTSAEQSLGGDDYGRSGRVMEPPDFAPRGMGRNLKGRAIIHDSMWLVKISSKQTGRRRRD
jgi:hypothetical protein